MCVCVICAIASICQMALFVFVSSCFSLHDEILRKFSNVPVFSLGRQIIYIHNLQKNTSSSGSSALTVRAGFVNEIAEVEQGGPGSQVLNKPLKKREKTQKCVSQAVVERN